MQGAVISNTGPMQSADLIKVFFISISLLKDVFQG